MRRKSESNALSHCETQMMKLIWDAERELSIQEIIARFNERHHRDYARSTIVTFLGKLTEKGYVSTHREGKKAYIHAEVAEKLYIKQMLREETDFWFDGSPSEMMSVLFESREISKEESAKMRSILDVLDT